MIINKLLILDYLNETANTFVFFPGANVIHSKESTTGKSCLLKSLYYALGLNISVFPPTWPYEKMLFKVYFSYRGTQSTVTRSKDRFWVDDVPTALSEKEYAEWLSKRFGVQIKLPLKSKEEMRLARPSVLLSLFFIDQDTSWAQAPYKHTVNLNMYKLDKYPSIVFEYLFGISNDRIVELDKLKFDLKREKNSLDNQLNVLNALEEKFVRPTETTSFDENKVREEIQKYLHYASILSTKISQFKHKIYTEQAMLDTLQLNHNELNSVLAYTKSMYKKIECKCAFCDSVLTREQSIKRMNLADDEFSINLHKIDLDREITEKIKKIDELLQRKMDIESEYNRYLEIASIKEGELTLEQHIQEKSKEFTKSTYRDVKTEIFTKLAEILGGLKSIDEELRELKKNQKERRETIAGAYSSFMA